MSIKDNDTTIINPAKSITNCNWIQSTIIGTILLEIKLDPKTNSTGW